jgi:hypothetical protein
VSNEFCTDEEPKVYSHTPMAAIAPMTTVARIGVLNLGCVLANACGSTWSAATAKVTRTPDTRLARVDPRAEPAARRDLVS